MRRADRLFRIAQLLRSGRLTTARNLAQKLEVSERTIYRDVQQLQLSGTPIEGEAGVGYTLRREFDIPPLMFDRQEITALVFGARMVKAWGGTEMAEAANNALRKIEGVLPVDLREKIDQVLLYAPGYKVPPTLRRTLDTMHKAAAERRVLELDYTREDAETSHRRVRPLGLYFWGEVWTLVSWCELRNDFRSFRADRIQTIHVLDESFTSKAGQTLADFMKQVAARNAPTAPDRTTI
jgi:predicted DNA-binding transcriptional regulator YafY